MHQKEYIGLHINIASHYIRRRADNFSARCGLTGIQSRIISYIAGSASRDVYQRDIERQFGIRRSSVTSVISNLEQNGFLMRCSVPGDARLKKLLLTEKGLEATREMSRAIQEFELSLSRCFTDEERQMLVKMLKRVIGLLDGTDGCMQKPAEPLCRDKEDTIC